MSGAPSYEELAAENAELRELNRVLSERLTALEARLAQTSRNSDKPPSSEGYGKPAPRSRRERTDRKSGGQPGHEGRTLRQVKDPDQVLVHEPVACAGCGLSLAAAPVVSTEARQVFDLSLIHI